MPKTERGPQVLPWVNNLTKAEAKRLLPYAQVAIYVMAGGSFVGRQYAEQPEHAYVDSRIPKRPYRLSQLEIARAHLVAIAKRAGYDPNNLPATPNFGNMGVF